MKFELVIVSTRDEYQGAQEPTSFEWRGERFVITHVVDRWYEGYVDSTRMPLRYFKVQTREGKQFILRYHELFRAWGLLVPHEDMA
jgi:hypothetical protein